MAETHLASNIDKTKWQSQYDECIKTLLSDKQVLARIMKFTVEEFKDYDINTIIECIEGEPEVSKHSLYPTATDKITGMNNESTIMGEGTVTFDIRFYAITRDKEPIKIILNVEGQKDYYPGYSIAARGIFYCARMISEQLDTEFKGNNYNDIKKVYSIWICMNVSEIHANTISEYSIQENNLFGDFKGNEKYDLLSLSIIRLPEKDNADKGNALIKMLTILLSQTLHPETKKELLSSEYDMVMENEMEGAMNQMSNLCEILIEKTRGQVTQEITQQVTSEKLIQSIDNIMESFSVSLEKACQVQKTTVEEYYRAKEFLGMK